MDIIKFYLQNDCYHFIQQNIDMGFVDGTILCRTEKTS